MTAAVQVFFSPGWLPGDISSTLGQTLITLCLLYILMRIPFWVARPVLSPFGRSPLRRAVRFAVTAAVLSRIAPLLRGTAHARAGRRPGRPAESRRDQGRRETSAGHREQRLVLAGQPRPAPGSEDTARGRRPPPGRPASGQAAAARPALFPVRAVRIPAPDRKHADELRSPRPVPIPSDVERPDKILAGLTARQVAIAAVAAVIIWAGFQATRHVMPLPAFAALASPVGLAAVALVIGERDGLPLDRLLRPPGGSGAPRAAWSPPPRASPPRPPGPPRPARRPRPRRCSRRCGGTSRPTG